MTLAEACTSFLADIKQTELDSPSTRLSVHKRTCELLTGYFSNGADLPGISSASLREFLGRWYVERYVTSIRGVGEKSLPAKSSVSEKTADSREVTDDPAELSEIPNPSELLGSLELFFNWIEQQVGGGFAERTTPVLRELSSSLPRALEITRLLSSTLREQGGAFAFPEFLTSFEEGGHSEYDIDTPGSVGAIEGYFRIIRVAGSSVEAEELISEERVWPILFPEEVAKLLDRPLILNLELVRTSSGWRIAGCGFVYPPGTDL